MVKKSKVSKKVSPKSNVNKIKNNKKTHVAILLDSSGSMSSISEETISSFNSQIKSIKESAKKSDTYVTLTLFNTTVSISKFAESINNIDEITKEDYIPSGFTAMYDAIGLTIERMKKEIVDIDDPNTAVLFIIITDGAENSSKTWKAQDISRIVSQLNETKRWTFSVLGANIDLAVLSSNIGIAKSNMAVFTASSAGVMRGTAVATNSLKRYFTSRDASEDLFEASLSSNFYSESEVILDSSKDIDKK